MIITLWSTVYRPIICAHDIRKCIITQDGGIGSQVLLTFETHDIGQTPSSLKCYLVFLIS